MARDEAKWAYWSKQINEWQASGLSRNAYCKREGIKPTTFDYWRALIVSDHADAESVKQPVSGNGITLVPVKVTDPARGDAALEAIKLKSPSGWEMHLPGSIEPQWLIAVLRQLP
jgi:hypothetical protein